MYGPEIWFLHSDYFFKLNFPLFREPIDNLTPEERDARTVFCMQLAARIRPRDLEEFFSTVGKVISREVKVILNTSSSCLSTELRLCRIVSKWFSGVSCTGEGENEWWQINF